MLGAIRKKTDNLIYSGIILAVVAVMAMYGIGKMGGGQQGAGGEAAAWVNGDLISRREFQQELERRLVQYQSILGGQYDEKLLMALQIPQRTLEELIQYKLLYQQSIKMNILVPDFELADHIRSLPYYQKNGKFDSQTYLKSPERGAEERWRRERLQIAKLQTYMADRIRPTPAELRRAYSLRETKVDLDYAKIDFRTLTVTAKPTSTQIDDYLKSAPAGDLEQYYDSHRKDFVDKGQVFLKQIRVSVPYQANDAKKKEARKKAESIAQEVNSNNFSQLAKSRSDDEYAKKGGTVGWITRGTLEEPVEATIEKLEVGKISAPIETAFGFFIVQVTQKKSEVIHPYATVKRTIAEKLLADKLKKQATDEKRKHWEQSLAQGKTIEPELKALKIDVKKTGPFSIGQGYIPNIGQADAVLDGVFNLTKERPVGSKLYYFQDHYYFIKLRSIEYAKTSEFSKNEAVVEKSLATALQSEVMSQWVAGLQKNSTIKTEIRFDKSGPTAPVALE